MSARLQLIAEGFEILQSKALLNGGEFEELTCGPAYSKL